MTTTVDNVTTTVDNVTTTIDKDVMSAGDASKPVGFMTMSTGGGAKPIGEAASPICVGTSSIGIVISSIGKATKRIVVAMCSVVEEALSIGVMTAIIYPSLVKTIWPPPFVAAGAIFFDFLYPLGSRVPNFIEIRDSRI